MANLQKSINSSMTPQKVQNRAKDKIAKLARVSEKWLPFGKCLFLDVLEVGDHQFSTPFDKQSQLGAFWASTFSPKQIDAVKAELYLSRFSSDLSSRK